MDLREKLAQFTSVTNSTEEIARKFLEACNGDIDMAIGMHLESEGLVDQDSHGSNDPRPSISVAQTSEQLLSPKTYEKM